MPVEPKKPRRVLRAVLRWTSAVLVFGALGGGVAYGVTQPERTRIPGLRTPDDGRWVYQPLALPKLPAGKPAALDDTLNPGGRHYADPRSLLLPAPEGARLDPAFPGAKGWLPTDRYRNELSYTRLDGAPTVDEERDLGTNGAETGAVVYQYVESGPSEEAQLRYAYISAGDTIGLVVLSHKGTVPVVPFRQTITLQAQLLG
ncbi:hypothetical protein C8250_024065 [Streptomyces sp. So13.3]|nr:hypothetical protein C8250_024065 [Streptomyces sp. So13.3]